MFPKFSCVCVCLWKITWISLPLSTPSSNTEVEIEWKLIYLGLAKQKLRAFQIVTNAITLPSIPVALNNLPMENWNGHHPFVNLFSAACQISGAFWCSAWIASYSEVILLPPFPNKILIFLVLLILGRCEGRPP